jgi:hypothetical protein
MASLVDEGSSTTQTPSTPPMEAIMNFLFKRLAGIVTVFDLIGIVAVIAGAVLFWATATDRISTLFPLFFGLFFAILITLMFFGLRKAWRRS